MVAPYICRVRFRRGFLVTWYVATTKRFLGREFKVGKCVFSLWMSDN